MESDYNSLLPITTTLQQSQTLLTDPRTPPACGLNLRAPNLIQPFPGGHSWWEEGPRSYPSRPVAVSWP